MNAIISDSGEERASTKNIKNFENIPDIEYPLSQGWFLVLGDG